MNSKSNHHRSSSSKKSKSNSKTLSLPTCYVAPRAYLDSLTHARHVLTSVEEVPSCSGSPTDNEDSLSLESKARITALQKRVYDAYDAIQGNPTDGRWAVIAQLLRMPLTLARYKYITVRKDGSMAEPGPTGWINAHSETEWFEWESMRNNEKKVVEKVERWKKGVETTVPPTSNGEQTDATATEVGVDAAEPGITLEEREKNVNEVVPISAVEMLKDAGSLGFKVVKRNTKTAVGKPPPASGDGKKPIPPPPENDSILPEQANAAPAVYQKPRSISALPETSFLPPSFPSQLLTSTPNAQHKRKPELILPQSFSSHQDISAEEEGREATTPPFISSPSLITRAYEKQSTPSGGVNFKPGGDNIPPSSSVISPPSTPTRPHPKFTNNVHGEKRPAEGDPATEVAPEERVVKRARTMPSPIVSTRGVKQAVNKNAPIAAPGNPVGFESGSPSLARLSSTSLDKQTVAVERQEVRATMIVQPEPVTPKKDATAAKQHTLPTLTELLLSAKKDKGKKRENSTYASPKPKSSPKTALPESKSTNPHIAEHPNGNENGNSDTSKKPAMRFPSPVPLLNDTHSTYVLNHPHDPYVLDVGITDQPSPSKSLSSLADSESSESDNEIDVDFSQNPDDFSPPFESTQAQPRPSIHGSTPSGSTWMMYNSQFDVDGEVRRVDRLLGKDVSLNLDDDGEVEIDYDGWLRDPSPDV